MLIGHSKQKKYFENLIEKGSLGHAYLFIGPEMIGKRTLAFNLARTVLGDDFEKSPDFKLIAPQVENGESKVYIEDIRDLKKFVSLKPYQGDRRLVVIDDVHCLTGEASNAILKILEEPPSGSTLILISSAPGLLLPTVVSRCEEVRFQQASEKEIRDYLIDKKPRRLSRGPDPLSSEEDMDFIIKLAGGRIGFIERLINKDMIPEAKKAIDELRKLLNSKIYEKIDYARKIHEQGDYQPRIGYWLSWVSAHVGQSPKNEKIVKELLTLNYLLSQPQYNHRLALENFLLNL